MKGGHSTETWILIGSLLTGGFLFAWMIVLADAVPEEYRSASPGFGWSWDFDYESAMRDAGRPGAQPWPWPAKETGNRLVLPLDQALLSRGLEITYRGMVESGRFRLDVIIQSLDPSFTYRLDFDVPEARRGFKLADRRFALERISPLYLRLRSETEDGGSSRQ